MKNNLIIQKLDELRAIVKKAKTGGDLYNSFKDYSDFVLENWPEGMADLQGWKKEMEFTLEKLRGKKNVKNLASSKDLPTFKTDSEQVMHHYDGEFRFFLNKSETN